jgi:hypothetical protein
MGWFDWLKRGATGGDPRIEQWRKDWEAASATPSPEQVHALRSRLDELGPDDERYEIEREMLDGLEAVAELSASVSADGLRAITTGHRAVGHDRCYFSAPASLPDDPAQPSGTFLLTEARAIFVGGSRSLAVPWHGVARCLRQERDLLLIRVNQQDLHRLRCNSFADALRAAFVAREVTNRRL